MAEELLTKQGRIDALVARSQELGREIDERREKRRVINAAILTVQAEPDPVPVLDGGGVTVGGQTLVAQVRK